MALPVRIVCPQCGSCRVAQSLKGASRIERMKIWWSFGQPLDPQRGRQICEACGHAFKVKNPQKFAAEHPRDVTRCIVCDQKTLELVQRDYRPEWRPPDSEEIDDLYRCTNCRRDIIVMVQPDPGTFYD